jgi:hypothetical protein
VRSFMLCEALHAFGPTYEELMDDEEFVQANIFSDYVTCKRVWLEGASENGVACKQPVLKDPKTHGPGLRTGS